MRRRAWAIVPILALASAAWGLRRQVVLSDRLAVGDRYEVAIEIAATGSGRTIEDGVVTESGSASSVDKERFVDTLLALEPGGRRAKVRRTYQSATLTHTPTGGKTITTRRPIQGRTFTISATDGIVQVDSPKGLSDPDIEDLGTALRDDAEILVVPGTRNVGDTWPIPKRFFAAFNFQGTGKGTCRFAGLEGDDLARITFESEVVAVSASGKTSRLAMSGYLLWSLRLKRLVAYRFGGPMSTVFSTRHGATVVRGEAESTFTASAALTWKAVAGKPIAAPPKRTTAPAASGRTGGAAASPPASGSP